MDKGVESPCALLQQRFFEWMIIFCWLFSASFFGLFSVSHWNRLHVLDFNEQGYYFIGQRSHRVVNCARTERRKLITINDPCNQFTLTFLQGPSNCLFSVWNKNCENGISDVRFLFVFLPSCGCYCGKKCSINHREDAQNSQNKTFQLFCFFVILKEIKLKKIENIDAVVTEPLTFEQHSTAHRLHGYCLFFSFSFCLVYLNSNLCTFRTVLRITVANMSESPITLCSINKWMLKTFWGQWWCLHKLSIENTYATETRPEI